MHSAVSHSALWQSKCATTVTMRNGNSAMMCSAVGLKCGICVSAILINGHGHYSAIYACRVCGGSNVGSTHITKTTALYLKRHGRSIPCNKLNLTVKQSKEELKKRGLAVSGKKPDLEKRLTEAIATDLVPQAELDAAPPEEAPEPQRVHVHWGGSS